MIRSYETKDKKDVLEIWHSGSREAHGFLGEEYLSEEQEMSEEYLNMAETLVYEENGAVKGFAAVLDKDFLLALYVEPGSRGCGIGTKLISHLMETYKSIDVTEYSENEKALHFFEKCGLHKKCETEDEDTGKKVTSFVWIGLLEKYKD